VVITTGGHDELEAPMTEHEREIDRRAGRARDIALFRYALIRQAADPALSTKQRGLLVRQLAATEHLGPFGRPVRYSRESLDRWIRAWRTGGFVALQPTARSLEPRTDPAVLDLAAALKREVPARTAAQVAAVLRANAGPKSSMPSARTLQRHFARLELHTRPNGMAPRSFGRFEAEASNDRWTGDALHGPAVGGRKTYLFAFIDDHSRALVGYRWGHSEDTVGLEAALRAGLAARGVPKVVYVDNGSAFVSGQLLRALASLGITLTHSKPGQPAGRGKIGRFFRTVREQFLVELGAGGDSRTIGIWGSSTSCSPRGSKPSTTSGNTARPDRGRSSASWPAFPTALRRRRPPPRNCTRRSCGRSGGP
jgi:putative transposase